MNLFKIKGIVQNYDWGGSSFIPDLLGIPNFEKKFAEYWMGIHEKGGATISETNQTLTEFIDMDQAKTLGPSVYKKFGQLPFLFKILDVADMLSIQVHPSKLAAEKGFALENKMGIPFSAKSRNYKDDNHKPEIMVALSNFWLLHGFKTRPRLTQTLTGIPELNPLLPVYEEKGCSGLYQKIMEEPQSETNEVLSPLMNRILPLYDSGQLNIESPEYWVSRAYHSFCNKEKIDKGIYSIFFFNLVKVKKGEAIFQDVGIPHAYLQGQNIELMANSDNVLRGGLTPKHVDVHELLKHVRFEETVPNVLEGVLMNNGVEKVYSTPSPDFELSKIDLTVEQHYHHTSTSIELFIIMDGAVSVFSNNVKIQARRGEAFVVTADSNYAISASEKAELYKAKCPV